MQQHPQIPWISFERIGAGVRVQCRACGGQTGVVTPAAADAFSRQHAEHQSAAAGHYGMGDVIARATKAVGIKPCTPCEARRQKLNQWLPRVWQR